MEYIYIYRVRVTALTFGTIKREKFHIFKWKTIFEHPKDLKSHLISIYHGENFEWSILFLVHWNASADSCSFFFLSIFFSLFCVLPIYMFILGLIMCNFMWFIQFRAWVSMHRCAWVWDEFSEYLLETRVLTSADFNRYPIQIFSFSSF